MIIMGCDPGSVTGLVVLDCHPTHTDVLYRYAADEDVLSSMVRTLCDKVMIEVLAIELPSQVFTHGRGRESMAARVGIERALLGARGAAGIVRGMVEALHPTVRVFTAQAHEVRCAVFGRIPRAPKGKDARTWIDGIIRARLPQVLPAWEKGAGDNDHNRDAAVAAIWGYRRACMPAALATPKLKTATRRKKAA